ncbi:hypothetical protein [Azohydromonas aeria]|uniref:hypothetical protein n=1 Tax=Azohydromonas aeria TaxID=2590212 RepID=UPI0012FA662B|nr:hypothetical protein [Azohydromonas aeria]
MKVLIDGVQYAPIPEPQTDKGLLAALDVRFDSDAGEGITVRDYLRRLLETLWDEGECFSGKRPFGNSGWEWDLFHPLAVAGFIPGTVQDGAIIDLDDKQRREAIAFVRRLIVAAFHGVQEGEAR